LLNVEADTKRDNLTFTELQLTYAEVAASESANTNKHIIDEVAKICNSVLGIPTSPNDISTAFPISKSMPTSAPVSHVKFVCRAHRDQIFLAKEKLKQHEPDHPPIYINEDFPQKSQKLIDNLRRMVRAKTLIGA
jgi:hypothetical protein